MFEKIFHHFHFLKIVLFGVFWALCGPLVVAIVLVARNCVERSFSELWKVRIVSLYGNFHFSNGIETALNSLKTASNSVKTALYGVNFAKTTTLKLILGFHKIASK